MERVNNKEKINKFELTDTRKDNAKYTKSSHPISNKKANLSIKKRGLIKHKGLL